MDFKQHYSSVHAYLEQYVKTATGGKVKIEYALAVNRMRLTCSVCGLSLTAAEPQVANEIDYGVQQFVDIHAHRGGHKDFVTGEGTPTQIKWKAMTCDFKPVTGGFGYVPLPPSANTVLKNIGKKIALLQQADTGEREKPIDDKQEPELRALKNVFTLKRIAKKDKPLKIFTGRKFR